MRCHVCEDPVTSETMKGWDTQPTCTDCFCVLLKQLAGILKTGAPMGTVKPGNDTAEFLAYLETKQVTA